MKEVCTSTNSLWVHGTAGSGKSAIASPVCEQLRDKNALAGSFYCKQDISGQRGPRRILPSLSYTLATKIERYRGLVLKAIENEPDISTNPLALQLTALIIGPLEVLQKQGYSGPPLLFMIDALGESGDYASRSLMADYLCRIASLSDWLNVLVTSRPLPELFYVFEPSYSSSVTSFNLNQVNAEEDIITYMRPCLEILVKSPGLDNKRLEDEPVHELARKAAGLLEAWRDFLSVDSSASKALWFPFACWGVELRNGLLTEEYV